MSWKTEARKIYETRVVADSLARLAKRFDLKSLPFSDEELQTLATCARIIQIGKEERAIG